MEWPLPVPVRIAAAAAVVVVTRRLNGALGVAVACMADTASRDRLLECIVHNNSAVAELAASCSRRRGGSIAADAQSGGRPVMTLQQTVAHLKSYAPTPSTLLTLLVTASNTALIALRQSDLSCAERTLRAALAHVADLGVSPRLFSHDGNEPIVQLFRGAFASMRRSGSAELRQPLLRALHLLTAVLLAEDDVHAALALLACADGTEGASAPPTGGSLIPLEVDRACTDHTNAAYECIIAARGRLLESVALMRIGRYADAARTIDAVSTSACGGHLLAALRYTRGVRSTCRTRGRDVSQPWVAHGVRIQASAMLPVAQPLATACRTLPPPLQPVPSRPWSYVATRLSCRAAVWWKRCDDLRHHAAVSVAECAAFRLPRAAGRACRIEHCSASAMPSTSTAIATLPCTTRRMYCSAFDRRTSALT